MQNQLLLSTAFVPPTEETSSTLRYVWECGCVGREGEVWLCSGERQNGTVAIVTMEDSTPQLEILPDKVCMKLLCTITVVICYV